MSNDLTPNQIPINPDDNPDVLDQASYVAAMALQALQAHDQNHPVRKHATSLAIYFNTLVSQGLDERIALALTRQWLVCLHASQEPR